MLIKDINNQNDNDNIYINSTLDNNFVSNNIWSNEYNNLNNFHKIFNNNNNDFAWNQNLNETWNQTLDQTWNMWNETKIKNDSLECLSNVFERDAILKKINRHHISPTKYKRPSNFEHKIESKDFTDKLIHIINYNTCDDNNNNKDKSSKLAKLDNFKINLEQNQKLGKKFSDKQKLNMVVDLNLDNESNRFEKNNKNFQQINYKNENNEKELNKNLSSIENELFIDENDLIETDQIIENEKSINSESALLNGKLNGFNKDLNCFQNKNRGVTRINRHDKRNPLIFEEKGFENLNGYYYKPPSNENINNLQFAKIRHLKLIDTNNNKSNGNFEPQNQMKNDDKKLIKNMILAKKIFRKNPRFDLLKKILTYDFENYMNIFIKNPNIQMELTKLFINKSLNIQNLLKPYLKKVNEKENLAQVNNVSIIIKTNKVEKSNRKIQEKKVNVDDNRIDLIKDLLVYDNLKTKVVDAFLSDSREELNLIEEKIQQEKAILNEFKEYKNKMLNNSKSQEDLKKFCPLDCSIKSSMVKKQPALNKDRKQNKMESLMPNIDMNKIENCLKKSSQLEKQRQADREEIRRRLAMDCDQDFNERINGRKIKLQSRLKSGMDLQLCFVNDVIVSDSDQSNSDTEYQSSLKRPKRKSSKFFNHCNTTSLIVKPMKSDVAPISILNELKLAMNEQLDKNLNELNEHELFQYINRLKLNARLALAESKNIARYQMEQEHKRLDSPISEMVRLSFQKAGSESLIENKRRATRSILTDLNITQLQVIVNDFHTHIETFNDQLMKQLVERDDLHMEQDSMLVDIEDLTRYLEAKEELVKKKTEKKIFENNTIKNKNFKNNLTLNQKEENFVTSTTSLLATNLSRSVKPHLYKIASIIKK